MSTDNDPLPPLPEPYEMIEAMRLVDDYAAQAHRQTWGMPSSARAALHDYLTQLLQPTEPVTDDLLLDAIKDQLDEFRQDEDWLCSRSASMLGNDSTCEILHIDTALAIAKIGMRYAHPPVQPTEPDHFAWWAKDNIPEGTDVAMVMLCRRAWRAASAPVQPTSSSWDQKALETAREISLMWGQDRSQFVSKIQNVVLGAMRWAAPVQPTEPK